MTAPKLKSPNVASENANNQVAKVAPYPISVQIIKVEGQPGLRAQIVKLTDFGFLMKVDAAQFYKVGENYTVSFDLPVLDREIRTGVKVIKTYDAMEVVGKSQVKSRTIEMHFKGLSLAEKSDINSYLVKSGQKKF